MPKNKRKNKRNRGQQEESQYHSGVAQNPQLVTPVYRIIAQQSPFKLFSSAIRVSRYFHSIYTGKDFWLKMIKHHFPFVRLEELTHDAGTNWGLVFRDIEQNALRHYQRFDNIEEIKLAFFYAKEDKLNDFKKPYSKLGSMMLDVRDEHHFSITEWAARYHHQTILDYIFFGHGHRTTYGRLANLQMAIRCKRSMRSIKQFAKLCRIGLNDRVRLHLACVAASHGYLSCLQYLTPAGTDMDWASSRLLVSACESGNMDCVDYVLSLSPPTNLSAALDICVIQDNITMLKRLLDYGMNPNGREYTSCLMLAVEYGRLACAQTLLAAGADVNYVARFTTLLNEAVSQDDSHMTMILLNHGASIHYGNHNITPTLHVAVDNLAVDCLALLLQYPVDWQQMPAMPASVVDLLIEPDNLEMLRLLLQAGLDPDTANSKMLYKAVLHSDAGTVQQLVAANANPQREVHLSKAVFLKSLKAHRGYDAVKRFWQTHANRDTSKHVDITPLGLARIIQDSTILDVLEAGNHEELTSVKRLKR